MAGRPRARQLRRTPTLSHQEFPKKQKGKRSRNPVFSSRSSSWRNTGAVGIFERCILHRPPLSFLGRLYDRICHLSTNGMRRVRLCFGGSVRPWRASHQPDGPSGFPLAPGGWTEPFGVRQSRHRRDRFRRLEPCSSTPKVEATAQSPNSAAVPHAGCGTKRTTAYGWRSRRSRRAAPRAGFNPAAETELESVEGKA